MRPAELLPAFKHGRRHFPNVIVVTAIDPVGHRVDDQSELVPNGYAF